jgi:hypothetical protein
MLQLEQAIKDYRIYREHLLTVNYTTLQEYFALLEYISRGIADAKVSIATSSLMVDAYYSSCLIIKVDVNNRLVEKSDLLISSSE